MGTRVRLERRLTFNVSGYDPQATEFAAGEHEVPAVVATFVAANPEFGQVLADEETPDDGAVATSDELSSELEDRKKAELLELAAELGVEVDAKATKAAIIEVLEAHIATAEDLEVDPAGGEHQEAEDLEQEPAGTDGDQDPATA